MNTCEICENTFDVEFFSTETGFCVGCDTINMDRGNILTMHQIGDRDHIIDTVHTSVPDLGANTGNMTGCIIAPDRSWVAMYGCDDRDGVTTTDVRKMDPAMSDDDACAMIAGFNPA